MLREKTIFKKRGIMKKLLLLLSGLLLVLLGFGCGKDNSTDDTTETDLVGVWDNANCTDRLTLNADKTFAWTETANANTINGSVAITGTVIEPIATTVTPVYEGSYWRDSNQINFEFSSKPGEIYQFTTTSRELILIREAVKNIYIKVPSKVNAGKNVAEQANCAIRDWGTPVPAPVPPVPPPPPKNDPMKKPQPPQQQNPPVPPQQQNPPVPPPPVPPQQQNPPVPPPPVPPQQQNPPVPPPAPTPPPPVPPIPPAPVPPPAPPQQPQQPPAPPQQPPAPPQQPPAPPSGGCGGGHNHY